MDPHIQDLISRAKGGGGTRVFGKESGPLNEDELTELARYFGISNMDRNYFHNAKEVTGLEDLTREIKRRGGWDVASEKVQADKKAAELEAKLNEKPPQLDLAPTAEDRRLVEQTVNASGDIARRQLEMTLPTIMGQVSAQAGAQGLTGGSAEGAGRGLAGAQAIRSYADLLSQQQAQGAQALLNLPLERAGLQTNANVALWNRQLGQGQLALGREQFYGQMQLSRDQLAAQQQASQNAIYGQIINAVLPLIL